MDIFCVSHLLCESFKQYSESHADSTKVVDNYLLIYENSST